MILSKTEVPESLTKDLSQLCRWPRLQAIFEETRADDNAMDEQFGYIVAAGEGWDTLLVDSSARHDWSRTLVLAGVAKTIRLRARAFYYAQVPQGKAGDIVAGRHGLPFVMPRGSSFVVDSPEVIEDLTAIHTNAGKMSISTSRARFSWHRPSEVVGIESRTSINPDRALSLLAYVTSDLLDTYIATD